jgi:SAM-dependent methyltransferase
MTNRISCICGGAMPAHAFSENFDALRCARCGTAHFVARADAKAAEFQYAEHNEKYAQADYLYGSVLRWSHLRLLDRDWAGRKVLEIGCFNGFFLAELRKAGAQVYGFDVNPAALEVGREIFKLETIFPDLEALRAYGPFDDIICVDVIEHVDSPETLLAELHDMLRPGGRLFVAGPTSERRMHDKSDFPPHHKWWFTRKGLTSFLSLAGFKVTRVDIQRDALLMLRNALGKLAYGFNRREYYGDTNFSPPSMKGPIASRLYTLATVLGIGLFTALRISYCSTLIELERNS